MSAYSDLTYMAASYRIRAHQIPEEAARFKYDPAPFIKEMNEKAELYEACARDIADLPDDQAQIIARKFRAAMWARDENPDYEPDDLYP